MDRRPELRRSMTLSEQLSTPDQAIRDFLKIPNDDSHLDDADRTAADSAGSGGMWKPLRDRLRLRHTANAWSSTPSQKSPTTSSDGSGSTGGNLKNNNNNNRSNKYIYAPGEATAAFSRTTSLRQTPTFSRATSTRVGPTAAVGRMDRSREINHNDEGSDEESEHDEEEDDDEEKDNEEDAEAPAAQMSLMALLGQSDDTWDEDDEDEDGDGGGGAGNKGAAHGGGGDEDEDDGDGDGEGREEEMVHVCCVCMVRHKGAAFIPCGHTFCRLCSRELWVSRGNCPLCNGFIQEILDIF
ncbi:transcription initiation factor TFIID subunit 11 [Brachypodium distachyon]|uniref:RING-type domain-containing protein n=1 Tax=Brachypodium distachyon TaxID=15368 RepID=A0A2K2DEA1_BRADI|nr:transcription initiation factor TFIID subunit 11 [Brachypodium distachyon]PNT72631.1 hypothetical protein BRADI_2g47230v3 [Brachypodium distachyon]|eukprot:XP_010232176.2 transcription initiation factor TFIID subunit 11 [Brachypodium distachyon]